MAQSTARNDRASSDAWPTGRVMIRSEDLLGGQRELGILHGGSMYRLSLTRQGKLILTK